MTTETLRPNAAGDLTELSPNPSVANYLNVDEETSDGDTTTVREPGTDDLIHEDLYNLPSLPSGVGAISNVTVYAMLRKAGSPSNTARIEIKTGGTIYYSDSKSLTTSWVLHDYSWATNPNTGVAWTESDVNALQAGIELRFNITAPGSEGWCTQVYIVVTYTPSFIPKVFIL